MHPIYIIKRIEYKTIKMLCIIFIFYEDELKSIFTKKCDS